jgi:hypothetical protein
MFVRVRKEKKFTNITIYYYSTIFYFENPSGGPVHEELVYAASPMEAAFWYW